MKKFPRIGFIYLLCVFIFFVIFLSWVARVGWYDRINTAQQTDADLSQWSNYLEKIADDFNDSKKRYEILVEAAEIRIKLSQPKKALELLGKALAINPGDEAINTLLTSLYWDTGQKRKAIKLAQERFDDGQRDWGIFSVILETVIEQTDTNALSKVIQAIFETNFPEKQLIENGRIIALGITADRWTFNGNPGFLIISESKVRLKISCYAISQDMPLSVTIEDQKGQKILSHVFHVSGDFELELPEIPDGENRLFIIKTDKYWVPNDNDSRRLGVRITPVSEYTGLVPNT